MSISQNYPIVSPSLNLDFANTKKLDPRMTFARASTATYYDGKTVAKAEENLFSYSQEFDNAYWTKTRLTITANTTTAPDGTSTAESAIPTAEALGHRFSRTVTVSSSGDLVWSIFAKVNGYNFIVINARSGGTDRNCFFNLSTGAVATNSSGGTASIVDAGNGWYRCSVVRASEGTTAVSEFSVCETDNVASFTANGTSGIFLWGAQLEARSTVTAYQPTTTQPITNYIPNLLTAPANVARFEHNPVTGESLGLEVEEQRTNLVTYSEDFGNGAWSNKDNASITVDQVVAPDGTLTADKLVENTATSPHRVYRQINAANNTFSFYAKSAGRSWVVVLSNNGNYTYFNLDTGTVGTVASNSTAYIQAVGNGWYRCSLFNGHVTNGGFIGLSTDGTTTIYTGDGYSGIYIWGAQLEAGAFPTSYIKTVASQVTRAADSASITGSNFSSWYRPDEGTLYAEGVSASGGSGNQMIASIGDGAAAQNQISMYKSGAALLQLITSSGATQSNLNSGLVATSNTNYKFSTAYKVNDFAFSVNANTVATDTSGQVPAVVNKLDIGNWHVNATGTWNSTIKKISYYPARLTNTQLQALTS